MIFYRSSIGKSCVLCYGPSSTIRLSASSIRWTKYSTLFSMTSIVFNVKSIAFSPSVCFSASYLLEISPRGPLIMLWWGFARVPCRRCRRPPYSKSPFFNKKSPMLNKQPPFFKGKSPFFSKRSPDEVVVLVWKTQAVSQITPVSTNFDWNGRFWSTIFYWKKRPFQWKFIVNQAVGGLFRIENCWKSANDLAF